MPKVSVLMSVYNAESYLRDAVDSILNQTFTDLEFIIVDDGSTDGTSEILKDYGTRDDRVRLVKNADNFGLTPSLNNGIQLANGEYIARQDADDVSLPKRLASQARFLDDHPEVGIVGTWISNFDETGRKALWRTPASHGSIRWSLLFGTCIAGASVMLRSSILEGDTPFRCEMLHAEDYDLWSRLSEKTQLANLTECFYLRRMHGDRVSVCYYEKQEETVKAVMHKNITKLLGEEAQEAVVARLRDVSRGDRVKTAAELQAVALLILNLYRAYIMENMLHTAEYTEVKRDVARRLRNLALSHSGQRPLDASRVLWQAIRLERKLPVRTCLKMTYRFLWAKLRKIQ